MVKNIAENEEDFMLLNKENCDSYLMTDLCLETNVCAYRAGITQVATTG